MKKLAFIDNEDEIDAYLEYKEIHQDSDVFCIAGNAVTMRLLVDRGVACIPITNYQTREQLRKAWDLSLKLSASWFYNPDGTDFTEYNGISFGKALKYEVNLFLNSMLKAISTINNIIRNIKPHQVFLIEKEGPISHTDFKAMTSIDMYRVMFQWFSQRENYEVVFLPRQKRSTLSILKRIGINETRLPLLVKGARDIAGQYLMKTLKRVFIYTVNTSKSLIYSFPAHRACQTRALVMGFTDLNYFGKGFLEKFLSYNLRMLYYLNGEMNCHLHPRVCFLPMKGDDELNKNKRADFLNSLNKAWKDSLSLLVHHSRYIYEGCPVMELCEQYFKSIISQVIPGLLDLQAKVEEAIETKKINIALLSNFLLSNAVVIAMIARHKGIPAVHIPHGHLYYMWEGGHVVPYPGTDTRNFPFYHSHEIVGMKNAYRFLMRSGVKQESLLLAGLPAFSRSVKRNGSLREKTSARKLLGFGKTDFVLLVATNEIPRDFDKIASYAHFHYIESFSIMIYYESLFRLFKHEREIKLVLKFRPSDSLLHVTMDMATKMRMENVGFFTDDLKNLLLAGDALLVACSNVGIEALFYDIPVIQYVNPEGPALLFLAQEGAAIELQDLHKLPRLVHRLASDGNYRNERISAQKDFLKRNLPDDGKISAQKVVCLIDRLAATQPRAS